MKLAQEVLSLCETFHTEIPPGARWITVFGRHVLVNAEGNPVNPNVKLPRVPGSKMIWKNVGGEMLPHFKRDTGKLAKFLAKKEAEKEAKKAERAKAKMDVFKKPRPGDLPPAPPPPPKVVKPPITPEEILPKKEFNPIGMSNHEANIMIKVLRGVPHAYRNKLEAISLFRRLYKERYGSESYPGLKRAKDVIEQYAWWNPSSEELKKIFQDEEEEVFGKGVEIGAAVHMPTPAPESQKLATQVVQQVQQVNAKRPIVRAHDKVVILLKKYPGLDPNLHSIGFMHKMCKNAGVGFNAIGDIKRAFEAAANKGLIIQKDGGWHVKGHEPMPVAPHPVKIERKPLNTVQRAFKDNPTESVKKHGECGINPAFIVKVKDDGKGLWKPVSGERLDWSHMDKRICKWAHREVMAYEMTRILGEEFDGLVPQTSLREVTPQHIPGFYVEHAGEGSCQSWVDEFTTAFAADRHMGEFLTKNSPEDIIRAGAFDILIGNQDRHDKNWGFDKNGRVTFIDNGISFNNQGDPEDLLISFLLRNKRELRDTYGNKLPQKLAPLKKSDREMLEDLKKDSDFQLPFKRAAENIEEIEKLFKKNHLPSREIDAFKARIRAVLGPKALK